MVFLAPSRISHGRAPQNLWGAAAAAKDRLGNLPSPQKTPLICQSLSLRRHGPHGRLSRLRCRVAAAARGPHKWQESFQLCLRVAKGPWRHPASVAVSHEGASSLANGRFPGSQSFLKPLPHMANTPANATLRCAPCYYSSIRSSQRKLVRSVCH